MKTEAFFYKLKICYRGTQYQGLQEQLSTPQTIQQTFNEACRHLCPSDPPNAIKSSWTSRTDSGVHALGQILRLKLPKEFSEDILLRALNHFLPSDIRVLEAERCAADFDPRLKAKWKEYIYLFSNAPFPIPTTPFAFDLVTNYPYSMNLDLLAQACSLFQGTHDFGNFFNGSQEIRSTRRTLYECRFHPAPLSQFLPSFWYPYPIHMIVFRGQGFLKLMIRLMVGALWSVGRGKVSLELLQEALHSPPSSSYRGQLGPAAPASGLYLKNIGF